MFIYYGDMTDAYQLSNRPEARVAILRIHSRKMSLQRGINLRSLAEKMGQCSGAEVRGICTEAGEFYYHICNFVFPDADVAIGMYALRERRQHVTQEDFEMAVAKVLKKNAEVDLLISCIGIYRSYSDYLIFNREI